MTTTYFYVDLYTDEVMPCAPTLAAWAGWLVAADPDNNGHRRAKDGDTFAVSSLVVLGDIQVSYVDGAWIEATPVPEGTTAFFLRHDEGSDGWDADHSADTIAGAMDCLEDEEGPFFLACVRDGDTVTMRLDVNDILARLVPARPKVYLAARYSRYVEMQGYRAELEAMGFEVTSRWINGDHQVPEDVHAQARQAERIRFATEDYEDLLAADIVVAFAEEPRKTLTRGGRHVEFGIALHAGKRLIAVNHRENVFYCLPQIEFCPGGWDEVKDILGPCDACGCVPCVGSNDNLMALCGPCLEGCKVPEDEAA